MFVKIYCQDINNFNNFVDLRKNQFEAFKIPRCFQDVNIQNECLQDFVFAIFQCLKLSKF